MPRVGRFDLRGTFASYDTNFTTYAKGVAKG